MYHKQFPLALPPPLAKKETKENNEALVLDELNLDPITLIILPPLTHLLKMKMETLITSITSPLNSMITFPSQQASNPPKIQYSLTSTYKASLANIPISNPSYPKWKQLAPT